MEVIGIILFCLISIWLGVGSSWLIICESKSYKPKAPDPPVVYYCDLCNEEIREGDEYYDFGEEKFCYSCVQEAFRTAEVEE
jgi:hypothetical protein